VPGVLRYIGHPHPPSYTRVQWTPTVVGVIAMSEAALPLVGELELAMGGTDDGQLRVQIRDSDSGEVYHSVTRSNDWFTSVQKRGEVINNTVANIPEMYAETEVRDELETVLTFCDNNEDEIFRQTRPESVEQVLAATEEVTATRGQETEFQVVVQHNGHEATLTFSAGEWAANSPHPLIEQWTAAFLHRPEGIAADRWEEIRDEWEGQLTDVTDAGATREEIVADEVVKSMKTTGLPAVTEKDALVSDKTVTLYDEDGLIATTDLDAERVLWVRSGLVMDKLRDAGETTDFASRLSLQLQEDDYLYEASSRHRLPDGSRYMLYPFNPETLNVDPGLDVVAPDDELDDEVEP